MKVGIVGAGHIAQFHVAALRSIASARIVGIADLDVGRAKMLAAQVGADAAFSDPYELIQTQRPDVVHILTPPQLMHNWLPSLSGRTVTCWSKNHWLSLSMRSKSYKERLKHMASRCVSITTCCIILSC